MLRFLSLSISASHCLIGVRPLTGRPSNVIESASAQVPRHIHTGSRGHAAHQTSGVHSMRPIWRFCGIACFA
eukprot:14023650-Alexandrium_andersonii.AAC.1